MNLIPPDTSDENGGRTEKHDDENISHYIDQLSLSQLNMHHSNSDIELQILENMAKKLQQLRQNQDNTMQLSPGNQAAQNRFEQQNNVSVWNPRDFNIQSLNPPTSAQVQDMKLLQNQPKVHGNCTCQILRSASRWSIGLQVR